MSREQEPSRDVPAAGDYAKWQVIAFLFKGNPFGKSFFLEDSGEMGGWVGTSEPLWTKRPRWSHRAGPSPALQTWASQASRGQRLDRPRAWEVWLERVTAACLGQGPPTGQA